MLAKLGLLGHVAKAGLGFQLLLTDFRSHCVLLLKFVQVGAIRWRGMLGTGPNLVMGFLQLVELFFLFEGFGERRLVSGQLLSGFLFNELGRCLCLRPPCFVFLLLVLHSLNRCGRSLCRLFLWALVSFKYLILG